MKKTQTFILIMIMLGFTANVHAEWTNTISPVPPGILDDEATIVQTTWWSGYPGEKKFEVQTDYFVFNDEYKFGCYLHVYARSDGESTGLIGGSSSKTVTGVINWNDSGTPPYKSVVESMDGGCFANGSARYDYFHTQDGLANSHVQAALGVKIIGSTTDGNNASEFCCSKSEAGVKTTDYGENGKSEAVTNVGFTLSWPPSIGASSTFVDIDDNPFESALQTLLSPVSTNAGYFNTWTIYWVVQGPSINCIAKGSELYGSLKYPSTCDAGVNVYFTPDFTQ